MKTAVDTFTYYFFTEGEPIFFLVEILLAARLIEEVACLDRSKKYRRFKVYKHIAKQYGFPMERKIWGPSEDFPDTK